MPSKTKSPRQGSKQEEAACQFLIAQGAEILEQNYYCKGAEIDIIARHQQHLHFIEVKARHNSDHGHPAEFLTPAKQKRIIRCAQVYLMKNPGFQGQAMQFDLIALLGEETEWLQNCFGGY